MRPATLDLAAAHFSVAVVSGASVLDVGSRDVNGSLRPLFVSRGCEEYLGVDPAEGPGVDRVTRAENLLCHYPPESFDIVVSSDALEHCENWRGVVAAMRTLLRPGGYLLLVAAPCGFKCHEPPDYWRFDIGHLRAMFADWREVAARDDLPGIVVQKPAEPDLSKIEVGRVEQPA